MLKKICIGMFLLLIVFVIHHKASAAGEFITTWNTANISPGSSNNKQITIPTKPLETYNYDVDWGDSNTDIGVTGNITHTYASSGIYTVKITGTFPQIYFNGSADSTDMLKILSVENWGNIHWLSMSHAFDNCANLVVNAVDAPDLTSVETLDSMFYAVISFDNSNHSINTWNISNITDISNMFNSSNFDQPLNLWNTSNVQYMQFTFAMSPFNQDISMWNTDGLVGMSGMFYQNTDFNQSLAYDQNHDYWNVSKVVDMSFLFSGATLFDQPLNSWNTSSLNIAYDMFDGSAYDQPLNMWNMSQVNNTGYMFYNSVFNQPLSSWNLISDTDMDNMFNGDIVFDQDLSTWNVANVTDMTDMFTDDTLSPENYSSILNSWANQTLQNNVTFDAGNSQYYSSASSSHDILTTTYNWTVNDGGLLVQIPLVDVNTISTITQNSAILNGNITDTRGADATERGFNYGNTASYGTNVSETGTYSTGSFSKSISGLSCGTTYHYQSYAINTAGTGSSPDQTFSTVSCPHGGGHPPLPTPQPIEQIIPSISPIDSSHSTLGKSCPYFTTYVRKGESGAEIIKIKKFLNDTQGEKLDTTSKYFDNKMFLAVKRFQTKYLNDVISPWVLNKATGRWYQSTTKKANDIMGCVAPVKLDNGKILN